MKRRSAVLLAAVPALVAIHPAVGLGARAEHPCKPGHAHQLAADVDAQVYLDRTTREVVGCAFAGRRLFVLGPAPYGSSSGAGGVSHVTLAGSFVAYESATIGGVESHRSSYLVLVRDLQTGKVIHRAATGTLARPEGASVGVGNVVALVLEQDGSVAWIADDFLRSTGGSGGAPETPFFDVMAFDRHGLRQLAGSDEIDPSSLALAAGATNVGSSSRSLAPARVYWTQGGTALSAPFS
jgi:hypothetical protein